MLAHALSLKPPLQRSPTNSGKFKGTRERLCSTTLTAADLGRVEAVDLTAEHLSFLL